MPPEIAVLGGRGVLGSAVALHAERRGARVLVLGHEDVEVKDPASVVAGLARGRPDVVVNSVALHDVDRCEEDPGEAFRVNALGALNVARAARASGARTVYVSTDYVFGGDKAEPYEEADRPRPVNVYGVSKAAGEMLTLMADPGALVVRVSFLFGRRSAKGGGFVERILAKAREGGSVRVVADRHVTPTYVEDAADAILDLSLAGHGGVVHVANDGVCSLYELAAAAVRLAGLPARVEPIKTSEFPTKAVRPAYSALSTRSLEALRGRRLRAWDAALAEYLAGGR